MIQMLCEYIRIKTVYPNADYAAVGELFKKYAQQAGFEIKELKLPSANPVFIITLEGSNPNLPALALNHHMDVVPAQNMNEWKYDPFACTQENDLIIGRGTQDMKGVGIVHYAALQELKESGFKPARTIHLLLVPDEERGGYQGAKELVNIPEFAKLNIGYVLDEGLASGNEKELLIKVDERTPMQIRIISKGESGHASKLMHENAAHILIQVLNEIMALHLDQKDQAKKHDQREHGKFFSYHITSLSTNNAALNVISSEAHATIDIRVPSHASMEKTQTSIENILKKHPATSYEILATSKERLHPTSTKSQFFTSLAQAISAHNILAKQFAFEATTDSRFYSNKGIEVLGLTPFTCKPNLHGTNESIRIQDLELGKKIMVSFLKDFC